MYFLFHREVSNAKLKLIFLQSDDISRMNEITFSECSEVDGCARVAGPLRVVSSEISCSIVSSEISSSNVSSEISSSIVSSEISCSIVSSEISCSIVSSEINCSIVSSEINSSIVSSEISSSTLSSEINSSIVSSEIIIFSMFQPDYSSVGRNITFVLLSYQYIIIV